MMAVWRCAMPATSALPDEFGLLVAGFGTLTDPRHARSKVHPQPGLLVLGLLGLLGLLAGCRSLSAVSRYGAATRRSWRHSACAAAPRWRRCTGCWGWSRWPTCGAS